ncbi:MAG: hypothetical protein ABI254_09270 [Chthoniobacterales bacterium]
MNGDISEELKRHGRPRDVRLLATLDRLVHRKLKKIAPEIVGKANREYADFLEENYRAGKIGVKPSKRARIANLERELADERQTSERFEKAVVTERTRAERTEQEAFSALQYLQPIKGETMEAAASRIVRERDDALAQLKGLWDLIFGFISVIMTKEFMTAIARCPTEIFAALVKLAKAVGQDLDYLNQQEVQTGESVSPSKRRLDADAPGGPVEPP